MRKVIIFFVLLAAAIVLNGTVKKLPALIETLSVEGGSIKISVNSDFAKQYLLDKKFFAHYGNDINLHELDSSITVIPFIMAVIPIIWVSEKRYSIDAFDHDLYHALRRIKKLFKMFYPSLSWSGELVPRRIVKNSKIRKIPQNGFALLFSGGLDAVASSFNHYDKRQLLITVQGGDIPLAQERMWLNIQKSCKDYASVYGHQNAFVSSNYSAFINKKYLSGLTPEIPRWSAFTTQALAYTGLVAPIMIQKGYRHLYIGGTYDQEYPYPYGTHPLIDNSISYAGVKVRHDLAVTRLKKIEHIAKIAQSKRTQIPTLRVCWGHEIKGGNCGNCDKCLRTITEILAVKQNPRSYGFSLSIDQAIERVKKYLTNSLQGKSNFRFSSLWRVVQNHIKEKSYGDRKIKSFFNWFIALDLAPLIPPKTDDLKTRKSFLKKLWRMAHEKSMNEVFDYLAKQGVV